MERETNYCTGVWKRNWYKMWCNKYKKFGFDRWAIKNTVQKFVFVHYTGLDCCYTITSLYKAQPWRCFSRWKMKKSLSRTPRTSFCTKPGWQSFLLVPKERKKQHLGHFPQKKAHAQHPPCFWPRGKKLQHSLNSDVTTKKKRYPFWNTCLMFFLIYISVYVRPS